MTKFFLASDRKPIERYDLQVWPGFLANVKIATDGVFLNVDTTTKFISGQSIYQKIRAMQKDKYSKTEIKDFFIPKD